MGKIFAPPFTPTIDYSKGWADIQRQENEYLAVLKKAIKANYRTQFSGEVVSFPHADGHAQYMVASMKPLVLIHIPLGDAWHYPHIERLMAKDIKAEIERGKALAELFGQR